jgi:L-ascorbate metabolism protein UlaG (beta-lactamase superfamily)
MRLNTNLLCLMGALATPCLLLAQAVKITPVGARTGEFCAPDRALILEDPTGVRILYDPATTVAGGSDTRLGRIDAILISHAHGDHLGNAKLNQDPGSPTARCDSATTLPTTNSNAAEIAAAKNSAVIVSGDLAPFLNAKIQAVTGAAVPGCTATGPANTTVVPLTQPCTGNLGYGAKRSLMIAGAQSGVQLALVSALHGNGLPSTMLADPLKSEMTANGLTFAPGGASGYVVTFTNGLRVYLSGDTGLLSDMETIVRGYYRANLVVLNVGDIFTTGPEEGAFAIDTLIKPAAVIPSHVNEVATTNGQVNAGTKTARFIDLVRTAPVYPPLSGVTMQFDGHGNCVSGCPAARQVHESH